MACSAATGPGHVTVIIICATDKAQLKQNLLSLESSRNVTSTNCIPLIGQGVTSLDESQESNLLFLKPGNERNTPKPTLWSDDEVQMFTMERLVHHRLDVLHCCVVFVLHTSGLRCCNYLIHTEVVLNLNRKQRKPSTAELTRVVPTRVGGSGKEA